MPCDDKVQYQDRRVAERVARRSSSRTREHIQPYWCCRHDCWHIGHSRDLNDR